MLVTRPRESVCRTVCALCAIASWSYVLVYRPLGGEPLVGKALPNSLVGRVTAIPALLISQYEPLNRLWESHA
eukprot:3958781-Pyramimonas_sp.AAC.1